MSANEKRRVEVDGRIYVLHPWSVEDGRRWLYRLIKTAVAGAGGQLGALGDAAIVGAALGALDEATFLELCRTIVKYTELVGEKDGKETVVQLSKIEGEHLRGNHFLLFALAKEQVTAEYGDFFARAGQLLPDAGAASVT